MRCSASRKTRGRGWTVESSSIDGLVRYNREMNLVFGACIEIRTTAARLDSSMLEMELLARNGVARAARLPEDRGAALLTLAQILADLPRRIRTVIRSLEERCQTLTRNTADASNSIRLHYELVRSLLVIRRRLQSETGALKIKSRESTG